MAFEFRWKTRRGKFVWDWVFASGSVAAVFFQGIPVTQRAYAGGWWNWLTPFSVVTGVALVIGYALLGACWLIYKTDGEVQKRARRTAWITGVTTLAMIVLVSLWAPFLSERYMARWFAWPQMLFVFPVPLLVVVCTIGLVTGLRQRRELLPFLSALGLFVLSFAGLCISFFPHIVPSSVTIWEAAAPDKSLGLLLVGAMVLLPLILAYTAYSYWVFRGKVTVGEGYH